MIEFRSRPDSPAAADDPDGSGGRLVRWFADLGMADAGDVGGKAASLGELYGALRPRGIKVPNGFVTTAEAARLYLTSPVRRTCWRKIDPEGLPDVAEEAADARCLADALHRILGGVSPEESVDLHARAKLARAFCQTAPVPDTLRVALAHAYAALCREYGARVDAAVRSSAMREDGDGASFAGQYESFLNVRGDDEIVEAWRRCAASAFTERAISYQLERGLDPLDNAVAVVVMKMVRSDVATSGVMFTLDPDTGNDRVVHVASSYGLGEAVVQGGVSPDTFTVWKEGVRRGRPAVVHRRLGDKDRMMVYACGGATQYVDVLPNDRTRWSLEPEQVCALARIALEIEDHYGRPMDIEWARDGFSGEFHVVQARPETIHTGGDASVMRSYRMDGELVERLKANGSLLLTGQAVGAGIGTGKVRRYGSYAEVITRRQALERRVASGEALEDVPPEERVFDQGDVLVTGMTTPDWEPLMKAASLIVTERGGRTSHAAIVAREFGIPALVGCGEGARAIAPLTEVTGTCAEGEVGYLFEGRHPYVIEEVDTGARRPLRTGVKLNVGFPDRALRDAMLPSDGVGLARLEFILTAEVGVHPLALYHLDALRRFGDEGVLTDDVAAFHDRLGDAGRAVVSDVVAAVERRLAGTDPRAYFVERVRDGVALICAAFHPRPVLVRLSDLKSNEYQQLVGGALFELSEENPMIAWRGASRYIDDRFAPAFAMEAEALATVRWELGLDNLQLMVPFCRTPAEGRDVVEALGGYRLSPEAGVPLFLMVELPSNVLEAEGFIEEMGLSGGSIGTNDLVQTVYAASRDDLERYPHRTDARSPSVKVMIRDAIRRFTAAGLEIGICGQAPSDHPEEIPPFLVDAGITSISVTADTLHRVRAAVDRAEAEARRPRARSRRRAHEPTGAPA